MLLTSLNLSVRLSSHVCHPHPTLRRYIRSERSIILVNFCLSILASNLLILVGQSQTLSKVRHRDISALAFQSAPALWQFWLLSCIQPELSKAGPIIVKSNFGLFYSRSMTSLFSVGYRSNCRKHLGWPGLLTAINNLHNSFFPFVLPFCPKRQFIMTPLTPPPSPPLFFCKRALLSIIMVSSPVFPLLSRVCAL